VTRSLLTLLTLALLTACGGGSGVTTYTVTAKTPSASNGSPTALWRWVRPATSPGTSLAEGDAIALCGALASSGGAGSSLARGLKRGAFEHRIVEVTPTEVRHAGRVVSTLDGGTLRDGDQRVIAPLFAALDAAYEADVAFAGSCDRWDFDGTILVAIDRRVPFETARAVLTTATKVRYDRLALLVRDTRPTTAPSPASDANHEAHLVISNDGSILASHAGSPDAAGAPGIADMGAALDGVLGGRSQMGCAVLTPDLDVPWSLVSTVLDELAALGISDPVLGGSGRGLAAPLPANSPVEDEILALDEELAALYLAPAGPAMGSGWCDPSKAPPPPPEPDPDAEPGEGAEDASPSPEAG
jgi:hypothetical protein